MTTQVPSDPADLNALEYFRVMGRWYRLYFVLHTSYFIHYTGMVGVCMTLWCSVVVWMVQDTVHNTVFYTVLP